jgi:hypothetical protein
MYYILNYIEENTINVEISPAHGLEVPQNLFSF